MIEKTIIEENQKLALVPYNLVGLSVEPKEWVWSNSALNAIDPDRGGHPRQLYKFMVEPREDSVNTSLLTGTLLHKYMEDRDKFGISEVPKPGEKLGIAADTIVQELLSIDSYEVTDEIILNNVRAVGWNSKWGDEAVLKNTRDLIKPYVQEVLRNTGKYILPENIAKSLNGAIESILNNSTIQNLIYCVNENTLVFTELELYGIQESANYTFKTKGKLDRVHIDTKAKVIRVFDYKTIGGATSKFLYSFKSYKYYRQMAFYEKLIKDLFPDYIVKMYIITVETSGLFISSVYEVTDVWLNVGKQEIYQLFMLAEANIKNDNFNLTKTEIINSGINILPYDYEPSKLY